MEQPVQHLFEWSPVGLLLFHADGLATSADATSWVCIAANGAACNLLGQLPLEKLSLDELFPPEVANSLRDATVVHPLNDGLDFFVSEPGRWLLASGNRTEQYLTITLTDVTRQKEASVADRRLARLYQSLSDSLDDHEIILFDRDFNIVLTEGQPRFIRLNIDGDLSGRSLTQLFEQNEFSFLSEHVSTVFGRDTRSQLEREINGRLYTASVYHSNRDDEARSVGVLLLKDVTELSQKQRELDARVEQLHRSNMALETFAYVASHDLKEPLRKIKSFGERLLSKYSTDLQAEGQMYVSRMREAAKRMDKLIDALLVYSRVTRQDEVLEVIDLGQCVSHALANLELDIEQKQAHIEQPDVWPRIEAMPNQMDQVFQNLISNALRFAPKDRPLVIKLSHRKALGRELSQWDMLAPDQLYCVVQIEDNGIGFAQENAERIFTVFQRLHGRSEYEGSGIGLAICKKIVEGHNGFITAQGQVGVGAVFNIVLPLTNKPF